MPTASRETSRDTISQCVDIYLTKTPDASVAESLRETLKKYDSRGNFNRDMTAPVSSVYHMLNRANPSGAANILDILFRYQDRDRFPIQILLEELNYRSKSADVNKDYVDGRLKPRAAKKEAKNLESMTASFNSVAFKEAMDLYETSPLAIQEGIISNFAVLLGKGQEETAHKFLEFIKKNETMSALKKLETTAYSMELRQIINGFSNLISVTGSTELPQTILNIYDLDGYQFNTFVDILHHIRKTKDGSPEVYKLRR